MAAICGAARFIDTGVRRAYSKSGAGSSRGVFPVPVTAKLSRKFYDKLGDDIANELVEWFNLVDATYRSDLRELNELNFERFRGELRAGLAELRAEMAELRAELREEIAQLETRLTKRLFAFWVGQSATTAALVLGLVKLVK
ncbi:MAG TPA: hypothetical protein VFK78_02005 [Gemmatimonadales bacterium]|nr:hypothetical protein [Gemmatimonadales bacterium]